MAWSVPAVALAGTAPAFAVSGKTPEGTLDKGFKYPGNACGSTYQEKLFGFQITVTNPDDQDIWLYTATTSVTIGGETFTNTNPITDAVLVPAGGQKTFVFLMQGTNSGNMSGDATMILDWGHTEDPNGDTYPHEPLTLTNYLSEFATSHDCTYAIA